MKISILTLFPEMFEGPFSYSIIKRAKDKGFAEIEFIDLRDFGIGPHKIVDDKPFGGGIGMVMKIDVMLEALEKIKRQKSKSKSKPYVILLSPRGKLLRQEVAHKLAKKDWLILICGHYEGVDERIRHFINAEISIGDYILTGGEIPAMVIVDAVTRLIPGVLSKKEATQFESFTLPTSHSPHLTLEYPQYTRPEVFRGLKVPKVLLSGNHAKIEKWRQEQAIKLTQKLRPDLLKSI